MTAPTRFRVILRRSRGRYVREWPAPSRYAAKLILEEKKERYDKKYTLEIAPAPAPRRRYGN